MRSLSGLPGLATLLVLSAGFASPSFGSGPITSGQVVAGAIAGPASTESWTFSGTVNDRILIAAVTTSGALNTVIRLIAPGSTEVVTTSGDRVDYKLTVGGTYTIIIQDDNLTDAGNYNLALLDVTAGPLTTGADADGGPIASAEVRSGQMNVIGDFDAFTFPGTAGDRVLVGALATGGVSFNTSITLYPPGGGPAEDLTSTGDRMDHQLAATGTYTVVIEDYNDSHTGNYTVTLLNLTAGPLTSGPDPDGGTIPSGDVKSGQATSSPDFDAYRFTANAGGRVLIAAVTTSGSLNTSVHLYPPTGPAVVNTTADRADYQLLVSGTYTIVVEDDNLTDGGSYNLSLLNATAGPLTTVSDPDGGPIASAEVRNGQMNVIGDFDAFTFPGTAGDRILVGALATGGVSFNTGITLYPPGGGPAEDYTSTGDRMDHQLAATGTYTVVIEDYNDTHTGNYTVTLLNLTAGPLTSGPDPDGGTIVSGDVKSGQASSSPDFDAYRFTASAGGRVLIAAVTTSGSLNTTVHLYPPSGAAVVNTTADRMEYQLAATGTYTIVVEDDNLTDGGSYNLSLLNVTAGPLTSGSDADGGAIASAEVRSGQMNVIGDFDAFTFSGTAGDRVLVGALATGGASFNTSISLYPPGGGPAEDYTTTGDRMDHQLLATGTYTVVIEDYNDSHTGNYTVTLLNLTGGPLTSGPDPDGGTIASGDVKSGQASSSPDFDAYRFTASVGNRVLIAAVTTSGSLNTTVHLYPPSGAAVVNISSDRVDYQVQASGTYTIVIEDDNLTDTGNYNLSLLNLTAGPLTTGPDPDGGPIASAEVRSGQMNVIGDFDAFTFSGAAGDRVLVGALATGGVSFNTSISLYPPGGGPAENLTYTGDRFDHQLLATGTYTLVIEDYGDTYTGSYTVTLLNLTAGPLTSGPDPDGGNIASGEVKSGQASTPDFDAYRFTANAGNRVLIAAVTTAGSLNTTVHLYPPGGAAAVATSGDRTDFQVAATGTYTIVVEDDNLTETGNYNLSLLNVTAGPLTTGPDPDGGPIASAEVRNGQINAIGDFDAFTFPGSAGDRILVGALATGGVSFNTAITLYPPGGGPAEDYTSSGDRLDHSLAVTGTYTAVIEDYNDSQTGSYTVTLLNLTAGPLTSGSDPDGGTIASGQVKSGQISTTPDFDGFKFVAYTGDTVTITAVATAGTLNTTIYVYPPFGTSAVATSLDNVTYIPTAPGIHTILIQDVGLNQTGAYNLAFNLIRPPTSVSVDRGGFDPTRVVLRPAHPNPFQDGATLSFSLPRGLPVRLRVYDLAGALVRTLVDEPLEAGPHDIRWDGRGERGARTASGVYYAELRAGSEVLRKKLVHIE